MIFPYNFFKNTLLLNILSVNVYAVCRPPYSDVRQVSTMVFSHELTMSCVVLILSGRHMALCDITHTCVNKPCHPDCVVFNGLLSSYGLDQLVLFPVAMSANTFSVILLHVENQCCDQMLTLACFMITDLSPLILLLFNMHFLSRT